MTRTKKGNPIPTKFDEAEENLIFEINEQTGLAQVEIIRRAVRLLRLEIERRGSRTFLFEELGPNKPDQKIVALRAAEEEARFNAKRKRK